MKSWYQVANLQKPTANLPKIATIYSIKAGAASLVFADGTMSKKYYRLSPDNTFAAGQKVRLEKICGTYVVLSRI